MEYIYIYIYISFSAEIRWWRPFQLLICFQRFYAYGFKIVFLTYHHFFYFNKKKKKAYKLLIICVFCGDCKSNEKEKLFRQQLESIRTIFQFLIVLQTAVYTAERFVIQWNFFDLKNPRFIIESGFKSRAGYNGARTVFS